MRRPRRFGAVTRGTTRAISSSNGSKASLSADPKRGRACSRRKKITNVKTRQRLMVRVSGMTAMGEKDVARILAFIPRADSALVGSSHAFLALRRRSHRALRTKSA